MYNIGYLHYGAFTSYIILLDDGVLYCIVMLLIVSSVTLKHGIVHHLQPTARLQLLGSAG